MMAEAGADHLLARGAAQLPFEVVGDPVVRPVGERANASLRARELGDEGVLHADRLRQVTHQRLEEVRAGIAHRAFDDRVEHGEVAFVQRRDGRGALHPVGAGSVRFSLGGVHRTPRDPTLWSVPHTAQWKSGAEHTEIAHARSRRGRRARAAASAGLVEGRRRRGLRSELLRDQGA